METVNGPLVTAAYAGDMDAMQKLWTMCAPVTLKRRCQWPGNKEEKDDFERELYLKFRRVIDGQKFKGKDDRFPAFWNVASWNYLRDKLYTRSRMLGREVRLNGDGSDDDFLGKHAIDSRGQAWREPLFRLMAEEQGKEVPA